MFSLKRLPISIVERQERCDGFTLVELVVVMALVGIMLVITIPNFQHLLTDDARKTSQWILLQVPAFKGRAVSENQVYYLNVDMDNRVLWFLSDSMSNEELKLAKEQGFQLTEDIKIIDVLYGDEDIVNGGEALISFYPKGYSDRAILHLEAQDGDRISFLFEPFLNQVEMIDGYVDFED